MPALLSSVAEFQSSGQAVGLGSAIAALPVGALDRMLFQASAAVNDHTQRLLAAPPQTTLAAAITTTAATSFAVTSAANIEAGDVAVFADGTTVEVTGADVTNFAPSGTVYPATVYVNGAVGTTASQGAAVTFYRQEQQVIRGKRTDPLDADVSMSQAGQVALMHAPKSGLSSFGREVFTYQYPLWSIHAAYQTLPWTGSASEVAVDLTNIVVERAGYVRLPVGFPNFLGSIWRIQYTAGFSVIPQDVRDAVHLLVAEQVARFANPYGGILVRTGDQMIEFERRSVVQGTPAPASKYIEDAHRILLPYCRKGR